MLFKNRKKWSGRGKNTPTNLANVEAIKSHFLLTRLKLQSCPPCWRVKEFWKQRSSFIKMALSNSIEQCFWRFQPKFRFTIFFVFVFFHLLLAPLFAYFFFAIFSIFFLFSWNKLTSCRDKWLRRIVSVDTASSKARKGFFLSIYKQNTKKLGKNWLVKKVRGDNFNTFFTKWMMEKRCTFFLFVRVEGFVPVQTYFFSLFESLELLYFNFLARSWNTCRVVTGERDNQRIGASPLR